MRFKCVLFAFSGAFEVRLRRVRNAFEVCSRRVAVRLKRV